MDGDGPHPVLTGAGPTPPGPVLASPAASATPAASRRAATPLAGALRNRDILRLELAWMIGVGADWALLVIVLLVAYQAGGPALVGLVALTRMIPASVLNVLVDTGAFARPEQALVAANLARGAGGAIVALAVASGLTPLVFLAVAAAAAAGALVRPTTLSLLPAVAVQPGELVGANVIGALGESLGTFTGPLFAAAVLSQSGAAPAAALAALAFGAAAVIAVRVRIEDAARQPSAERPGGLPVIAGIRELIRRPPAGWVMLSFLAQTTVRGALTTFLAILAIEVLGMGDGGIGLLGAALGLGGIAGAVLAMGGGGRRGLTVMFAGALVAWGLPIAVIGVVPVPPVALAALIMVGLGNALLDVSGFTLLQRGTANRARTSVFAVLEVVASVGVSVGGVLGSILFTSVGIRTALVVTGLLLPVMAAMGWRWIRCLDLQSVIPERQAALLRGIPLFAGLPIAGLERVATGMREVRFAAGAPLMTQGEHGDVYLILAAGTVRVEIDGRFIHDQGPGDGIGEIALLRAVPRTATVTALTPVDAYAIDSATFVSAVTGHRASTAAAQSIVESRLHGEV